MDQFELEQMLDKAAKRGAQEALRSIGLSDSEAYDDVREIRSLLDAYRAAKTTVWTTVVKLATVGFIGFLLAGAYFNSKGA